MTNTFDEKSGIRQAGNYTKAEPSKFLVTFLSTLAIFHHRQLQNAGRHRAPDLVKKK